MQIESQNIHSKTLDWTLRCPIPQDAAALSALRVKIDGETEFLDREPGEDIRTPEAFAKMIKEDLANHRSLFLIAEVMGSPVGFCRCVGGSLFRFRHKAEFGICILQEYSGFGIGSALLDTVVRWADEQGIEKITLSVVETNSGAIHLYQKFGFVKEGLLVKDRLHRDGQFYNTLLMARFRDGKLESE